MSDLETLKPCPFCGGDNIKHLTEYLRGGLRIITGCFDVDCGVEFVWTAPSSAIEDHALSQEVKKWNARQPDIDAKDAEIERLRWSGERGRINWISEEIELPPVGLPVLHCSPRQRDEYWKTSVRCILIDFEGVIPRPVPKGSECWPTAYFWGDPYYGRKQSSLVTGNGYWAHLSELSPPPSAEIYTNNAGEGYLRGKDGSCLFVGQKPRAALTKEPDNG